MLSVEPYGMKLYRNQVIGAWDMAFSALGRAVWDETDSTVMLISLSSRLSVLSVEPYGMKLTASDSLSMICPSFSALGRAVWDETGPTPCCARSIPLFQCSRSSRMG